MSNDKTGGSAFPITEQNGANSGDCGMSLRDYFAAKAMAVMGRELAYVDGFIGLSRACYEWADAMLKARSE